MRQETEYNCLLEMEKLKEVLGSRNEETIKENEELIKRVITNHFFNDFHFHLTPSYSNLLLNSIENPVVLEATISYFNEGDRLKDFLKSRMNENIVLRNDLGIQTGTLFAPQLNLIFEIAAIDQNFLEKLVRVLFENTSYYCKENKLQYSLHSTNFLTWIATTHRETIQPILDLAKKDLRILWMILLESDCERDTLWLFFIMESKYIYQIFLMLGEMPSIRKKFSDKYQSVAKIALLRNKNIHFENAFTYFLRENLSNKKLASLCDPNTLLGALIDEQAFPKYEGISVHRKEVNKALAQQYCQVIFQDEKNRIDSFFAQYEAKLHILLPVLKAAAELAEKIIQLFKNNEELDSLHIPLEQSIQSCNDEELNSLHIPLQQAIQEAISQQKKESESLGNRVVKFFKKEKTDTETVVKMFGQPLHDALEHWIDIVYELTQASENAKKQAAEKPTSVSAPKPATAQPTALEKPAVPSAKRPILSGNQKRYAELFVQVSQDRGIAVASDSSIEDRLEQCKLAWKIKPTEEYQIAKAETAQRWDVEIYHLTLFGLPTVPVKKIEEDLDLITRTLASLPRAVAAANLNDKNEVVSLVSA